MKATNKVVLWVSIGLLGAAGLWAMAPRPAATAELQIFEAIHDAEEAARNGNVSGTMDLISERFKAGSLTRSRLQLLLMRARNSARGVSYDVRASTPKVLPENPEKPNQRVVFSTLSAFDAAGGDTIWGGGAPVTLVMERESRRRFVVFTEPRWRVVGIANLPALPGSEL